MKLKLRTLVALTGAAVALGVFAACSDEPVLIVPPDTPTGLAATATSTTSVSVTWNQIVGAESYELDRAEGAGDFASVATGLTSTAYTDNGLTPNTEYRYRVRAVNSAGESGNSSLVSATTLAEGPKVATVTGITNNRTFYADTVYTLSGYVKVSNGATLTIEAGTRILGDTTVPGSSLWILRGSDIVANGTAAAPIVFTSARAPGNRAPGDWGGIIIVGNAPINRTAHPIFTEGPTGAAEDYSDGDDFDDSSGSLTYVRIEFAGYDVSQNGQELNGISSYAVGRGTTYDYIQNVEGLDDSFEFFGGGVDIRHMVSFESGDDHFDTSEGFQGRAQYLIAVQTTVPTPRPGTGKVSSDPRGFESDGCEDDKAGCTFANTPYTQPVWANFTVVGPGTGVFSTNDGNGAVVRRGSAGTFVNGIIARWPGVSFSVRDQESKDLMDADTLYIRNLVFAENGATFEAQAAERFGYVLGDSATQWSITTSMLADLFAGMLPDGATAVTTANLNIGLATGAAARTGGLSDFTGTPVAPRVQNFFGGAMPATAYIGAVDPGAATPWYEGWTAWYRN